MLEVRLLSGRSGLGEVGGVTGAEPAKVQLGIHERRLESRREERWGTSSCCCCFCFWKVSSWLLLGSKEEDGPSSVSGLMLSLGSMGVSSGTDGRTMAASRCEAFATSPGDDPAEDEARDLPSRATG